MFKKLSQFDFAVDGCKRVEIGNGMIYFGEAKDNVPHGYGVILSRF